MKCLTEIKGLFFMVKMAKCLYFVKKMLVIAFFACLACMGCKCLCGDTKALKKKLDSICGCCK